MLRLLLYPYEVKSLLCSAPYMLQNRFVLKTYKRVVHFYRPVAPERPNVFFFHSSVIYYHLYMSTAGRHIYCGNTISDRTWTFYRVGRKANGEKVLKTVTTHASRSTRPLRRSCFVPPKIRCSCSLRRTVYRLHLVRDYSSRRMIFRYYHCCYHYGRCHGGDAAAKRLYIYTRNQILSLPSRYAYIIPEPSTYIIPTYLFTHMFSR